MSFNQSECFISVKSSYTTLKFVYDIGSRMAKNLVVSCLRGKLMHMYLDTFVFSFQSFDLLTCLIPPSFIQR